ncbi:arsenite efflux ATP-binding protein ArsA [Herbihabitans rhizosphaerae]|uniref:Arsenite efflux ATP-binding protein ArsA n=1 Tax=Herbihabitans rhizosphaerae TaxID=1872711 RepID=A0A4Q7KT06_9PSEU|nr:ArsA family ATPase [Herbihabitans rhizosphaerae]RZS38921.1 arsenite efflux ATP-binding protein ArsA [Herbihabitans rhizosphaerae]
MRILLFTGKGGVGKTTLAAATAAALASAGRKTLVVSTDPAHSLADAFGTKLTGEPSEVDDGLYASHVDARALVDKSWDDLRRQARTLLAGAGVHELDAEELTVLPGVDELLALTEVRRLAETGPWEVVVVDCGPTAETLRLLALPEAVSSYLDRLPLSSVGAPVRRLAEHLRGLRALLTDARTTTVRLVLTPERLVVAETRRTLAALALRDIQVDAMIANRLMPRAGRNWGRAAGWLRTRRREQDAVLSELDSSAPVPLRTVEHRAAEPVGTPALLELAEELYAGADPLGEASGQARQLLAVQQVGTAYELRISLPLNDSTDLDLARVGDDLAVTVDGLRRLVALPMLLRRYTVTDAEATSDGLVVRFEPGVNR